MELSVVIVLIPILFRIFAPHFNLGLSFWLSSPISLKWETPLALAATKKISKNSSMAPLFSLGGQLIGFNLYVLVIEISARSSPL